MKLACWGLEGQVCWVRFTISGLLGQVFCVTFFGKMCRVGAYWIDFAKEVKIDIGNLDKIPDSLTD